MPEEENQKNQDKETTPEEKIEDKSPKAVQKEPFPLVIIISIAIPAAFLLFLIIFYIFKIF